MRTMIRWGFLALLAAASTSALAARTFTATLTPVPEFDMSSTQTLTFSVNNTSTTDRIYRLRIRLPGTCTGTGCVATVFTSASAAPLNWTRTAFTTTSITYQASTYNDAIPASSSLSVSVVITAGKSTLDRTEVLRDVRAYFTIDTNFANGITSTGNTTNTTNTNFPSWILQSLQITAMQTTDTSGVSVSAIAAGTTFRVVITVKNISSATLNTIVANPTPPTPTKTGTFGGSSPSCSLTTTSPSPFNLTAGSTGTMTYTCTTLSSDSGTVKYSVTDVRSGTTATSRTGQSNVLSVSPLSVGIAITGPYVADTTCHFSGDTATFVMTVTNNTSGALTSITPSALTRGGSSTTIGTFTGPTTSCTSGFPLPVGGNCKYTWTAPVTIVGNYPAPPTAKPTFFVTGSATANPGSITSPVVTAPAQDVDGFVVTVSPTTTNTTSTSQQLTFSVTNRACDNLNQVAISVPGGFTYGNDGYSLVTDATAQNENWGQAATTFTAGAAVDRMPIDKGGDFSLVFSATPSAAATYTFGLNLIDENGVARAVNVDVPVATFGSGTLNSSSPATWHEVFQ
ncbi:MAG TPA: hypothetical protein VE008_03295 [Burkholderiales bacterium]|nr:hypothetical protein [Burkholderiales bacterium]